MRRGSFFFFCPPPLYCFFLSLSKPQLFFSLPSLLFHSAACMVCGSTESHCSSSLSSASSSRAKGRTILYYTILILLLYSRSFARRVTAAGLHTVILKGLDCCSSLRSNTAGTGCGEGRMALSALQFPCSERV